MKDYILVIEDEQSLSQALCDNLEMSGYEVKAVFDGEEALVQIGKKVPSLILTDLLMPKVDGFELIAELKRREECKGVPIIVLSNLDGVDAQLRVAEMGVSHYLIKSEQSILTIMKLVRSLFPEKVADVQA